MFTDTSLRGLFFRPWQSLFNVIPAKAGIHFLILLAFLANTFGPMPLAHADDFRLPTPGMMVPLSPAFNPPILKGIKVHPDNPFRFDFILDKGDSRLSNSALKDESSKLIKYFLASLTIPEKDLWVNLSPYEKDRIVPESFGRTEMGRDLLAEDYMLKQITASLIYPEGETGKKFWKRIYQEAAKKFGTTNIPVNTFNKVWIVPEKAVVFENAKAGTAYVVESKLKVMLEQDYLSLEKHEGILSGPGRVSETNQLGSKIVREIVIPELTKEINFNQNFSQLRQVYNSLILATWYKKKIKDSILAQVYENKDKVAGVNVKNPRDRQKIYERYLEAFKKGVFNFIKEEPYVDPALPSKEQGIFPRKYFSGGTELLETAQILRETSHIPNSEFIAPDEAMLVNVQLKTSVKTYNYAMLSNVKYENDEIHHQLLVSKWAQRFVKENFPSFKNFMEQILFDPQWGFYGSGHVTIAPRLGAGVHFVTYPEYISPFFGQMLAEHAYGIWKSMGGLDFPYPHFDVMEFGAGNGTLAYDFISYVKKKQEEGQWGAFAQKLKYTICEVSPELRKRQAERLRDFIQDGLIQDGLASIKDADARNPTATIKPQSLHGFVFSNEVPDVFGVHKIAVHNGEMGVAFVVPRIKSGFLNNIEENVPGFSSLIRDIKMEDSRIRHNLSLQPDHSFMDYYLSSETYKRLMDAISALNKDDYAKAIGYLKFEEIYLPIDMMPKVQDVIRLEEAKFARAMAFRRLHTNKDGVFYINMDLKGFMHGIGEILASGYVMTIDYGDSFFELIKQSVTTGQRLLAVYPKGYGNSPYQNTTLLDITSLVDFDLLSLYGRSVGLSKVFYGSQGNITTGTPFENDRKINETLFSAFPWKMMFQRKAGTKGGYNPFNKVFDLSEEHGDKDRDVDENSGTQDRNSAMNSHVQINHILSTDSAMRGGIDLTSDKTLTVQNNGQAINFHIDPAMLKQLENAPGFTPVIINMEPMVNLRAWLGLSNSTSV